MDDDHLLAFPGGVNADISHRNHLYSLGEHDGAMVPSTSCSILRLRNPCTQEGGHCLVSGSTYNDKRKVSRIIGWGLRRFSKIVCQKVQAKGRTTYNEKKHMNLKCRMHEKANFLKELEAKALDFRKLIMRNQLMSGFRNASSEGVALPFVLVQTNLKATVEIEISQDMQLVQLDFNGSPFSLHDEAAILKMMRCTQAAPPSNQFARGSLPLALNCGNRNLMNQTSFSWNSES